MKRVVWFTMGAAAGVAGTTWTQRKLKQAAAAAKPRAVASGRGRGALAGSGLRRCPARGTARHAPA